MISILAFTGWLHDCTSCFRELFEHMTLAWCKQAFQRGMMKPKMHVKDGIASKIEQLDGGILLSAQSPQDFLTCLVSSEGDSMGSIARVSQQQWQRFASTSNDTTWTCRKKAEGYCPRARDRVVLSLLSNFTVWSKQAFVMCYRSEHTMLAIKIVTQMKPCKVCFCLWQ